MWYIAAIQAILTAAAGRVAVRGIMDEAKMQRQASKYNSARAYETARQINEMTAIEAAQIRRRNMMLVGAQRAAASASGMQLSGSFSDVSRDSAVQGELAAAAKQYEGAIASRNYVIQAGLERFRRKMIMRAARYKAWGTALSSVGAAIGGSGTNWTSGLNQDPKTPDYVKQYGQDLPASGGGAEAASSTQFWT